MKSKYVLFFSAAALAAGIGFSSCGNGGGTQEGKNKPDTSAKVNQPSQTQAPAGKIATGTDIKVTAEGNTMAEMHYDVSEIHVPAHTKIKISITNNGKDMAMVHNIVVLKPENADSAAAAGQRAGLKNNFLPDDKSLYIAATPMAQPGETKDVSFETPDKGTYMFMCSYPGHYKIMNGKFIVE